MPQYLSSGFKTFQTLEVYFRQTNEQRQRNSGQMYILYYACMYMCLLSVFLSVYCTCVLVRGVGLKYVHDSLFSILKFFMENKS